MEEAEPLQSVARRKTNPSATYKTSRDVLHPPHGHGASSPLTAELHQAPFCLPQLSSLLRGLSAGLSGAPCAGRLLGWAVLRLACWKAQESRNTPGMRSPKYSLLLAAMAWYFTSSRYSGVSFSYKKQRPHALRDNFLGPGGVVFMSGLLDQAALLCGGGGRE